MIISDEQKDEFPRLHRCLRRLEGAARDDPDTVAMIVDLVIEMGAVGPDSRQARDMVEKRLWHALKFGGKPSVMVMVSPGACSQYLPGTNRIVLERTLVEQLEALETEAPNKRFLRQEVVGVLLQGLVLWLCDHGMETLSAPVTASDSLTELRKSSLPGV